MSVYEEEPTWSREENKLFERALAQVPVNITGRWDEIAKAVPGKTEEQVRLHFEALGHALDEIEAWGVEIPRYTDDYAKKVEAEFELKRSHRECEMKKGTPWTEEEHKNFLQGLEIYGKGDWRSISRNAVKTRTPTQVASHAQKFFLRQSSLKKIKNEQASTT